MKFFLPLAAALALNGCASSASLRDADKLALYQASAGAPVSSFRYFGSINGWTPLGDSALAIWTSPNQAYLLDVYGPCSGLEFAPAIGLTQHSHQVSARFDDVLLLERTGPHIPCRIRSIRPLDVKAIRSAERGASAQDSGT